MHIVHNFSKLCPKISCAITRPRITWKRRITYLKKPLRHGPYTFSSTTNPKTLSIQEESLKTAIQSALLNAIDYLLTHKNITTFDYKVSRVSGCWTSYVKVGHKTYGPCYSPKPKQAKVKVAEAAMSCLS